MEEINKEVKPMKNVTNKVDVIKETLSMDTVALPVLARMRKRVMKLHELSKAKIQKIPRGNTFQFITERPKLFMSGLKATYSNGTAFISYSLYKTNVNGDKEIKVSSSTLPSGKTIEVSAEYIIYKTIVETIEYGRAIKVEEINNE